MYSAFNTFEDIICIVGDTLPTMNVTVENMDSSYDMEVRIYSLQKQSRLLTKSCIQTETGFFVKLLDTDMAVIPVGKYWLDFVLINAGYEYKKLRGKLIVVEG